MHYILNLYKWRQYMPKARKTKIGWVLYVFPIIVIFALAAV
jgi:hypothetical protein